MECSDAVVLQRILARYPRDTLTSTHYISRVYFFFSSRRRHTRLQGDWSSDVCSSDLRIKFFDGRSRRRGFCFFRSRGPAQAAPGSGLRGACFLEVLDTDADAAGQAGIGRAAGRGRGEISGGAGSIKKKKEKKKRVAR